MRSEPIGCARWDVGIKPTPKKKYKRNVAVDKAWFKGFITGLTIAGGLSLLVMYVLSFAIQCPK